MRHGHLLVTTSAHTAREVLCVVEPLTAFRQESICASRLFDAPQKVPFFTFFWSPSDVPGDPPNPLSTGLAYGSNPPIRDFLYRQEVVQLYRAVRRSVLDLGVAAE